MALLTATVLILICALTILSYLIWIFGWRWEVLQFAIVIAFGVTGLFAGSAISPGSRVSEGTAMLLSTALGFAIARWATKKLSEAIDRRAGPSR